MVISCHSFFFFHIPSDQMKSQIVPSGECSRQAEGKVG